MRRGVSRVGHAVLRRRAATRIATLLVVAGLVCVALLAGPSCQSIRSRVAGPIASPAMPSTSSLRGLPPLPGTQPDVRVRLARGVERIAFGGDAALVVTSLDSDEPTARASAPATIERRRRGFRVRGSDERVWRFLEAAALRVETEDGSPLTIEGTPYAGPMRLTAVDRGVRGFDVVEHTFLETYLPGVLARELYRSWRPQTYEAQAIAARSYALHERARRRRAGDHFDLEGTTADQAYGGLEAHRRAIEGVRRTAGLVLTWEGGLLRSYYSSTCGGRAGSASDTWPATAGFEFNRAGPIQASRRADHCAESPRFRWSVTRDRAALAKRLAAFGEADGLAIRSIESVARVEPSRVNPFGRPATYKVFDDAGRWWPLSGEQLRLACNFSDVDLPPITGRTRVLSGDIEMKPRGERMEITGRGFGHGVGMCQFGAERLAREGRDAVDILGHFYPDSALERAY